MKILKLIPLVIVMLSGYIAAQQSITVTGTVSVSNTGKILPYAQIVLEGTNLGAITDDNGIYKIDGVQPGTYRLMAIYTGYRTEYKEITVVAGTTSEVGIVLTQAPISVEEILVTGNAPMSHVADQFAIGKSGDSPKDVGEFFKTVSGASAVKKGGFAMDPVMRGFQQDQLNVQIDGGCKCWGGCPNRMDPPTSHIQSEDIEKIEVIKGPFSMRWGPTMGGIINLVMKRPQFTPVFSIHGGVSTGYESNGGSRKERLTLNGGSEKWDFYVGGGEKVYGNYVSGGDKIEIPSSFTMRDYSIKFGVNPSQNQRFQVSWRQSFARDVSFPALPMDASIDDTNILAFDYSARNLGSMISSVTTKIYYSDVYHVMDNFKRNNFKMVESETIADAITYGGRFELKSQLANTSKLFIGNDYYLHSKDGNRIRFVKTNPCNTMMHPNKEFIDDVWQNSSVSDYGIFGEYHQMLSKNVTINTGLRFDFVNAKIGEPSDQFIAAYGEISDFNERTASFMGLLKYLISPTFSSTVSIGRGTRSADITERFINHLPVGKSPHEHFGNPNLIPEINDQIELAVDGIFGEHHVTANVFYSKLSNYILAKVDSTNNRVYLPCDEPKYSKVFDNLNNAFQYGYELQLNGAIMKNISYFGTISYLYGQNSDIDEPLPEIQPFSTGFGIKYESPTIPTWFEVNGRIVAKQDRISATYGESETDGYQVFNAKLGYTLKNLSFILNVNNIFDAMYYDHLSRSFAKNIEDTGLPYYEQGRNVSLNVKLTF